MTIQIQTEIDRSPARWVGAEVGVRRCAECGADLTAEEVEHYDRWCEDCEGDWNCRIESYRKGAYDPVMDLIFSA